MWLSAVEAWNDACARWLGVSDGGGPACMGADKRFEAPEWHGNPAYRTLKDMYLLASDFLLQEGEADDLDPAERDRLRFHLQQFVNAMSPTLLLALQPRGAAPGWRPAARASPTAPATCCTTSKEGRLSMVDATAFAPGRNLAITPGKVVFRNRLIELIQYAADRQVRAVPLLFIPPWINKYYILDMQPKNSLVRYLVEQGFTVFVDQLEEPGRLDGGPHLRGLHATTARWRRATRCARSPAAGP